MHLSLLIYHTVNRNVPSYLSALFSNACENNPYKSKLRNTEYNVVLDHVPKQSIIKALSHIEEEYSGIHYQLT